MIEEEAEKSFQKVMAILDERRLLKAVRPITSGRRKAAPWVLSWDAKASWVFLDNAHHSASISFWFLLFFCF
jgi:hypothetical protein